MSTATILHRVRLILNDNGETFYARVDGDNTTTSFELPEDHVDPTTVTASLVPVNGGSSTVLTSGTDYTIDQYNGLIQVEVPPALGQLLEVQGLFFETFDDADLTILLGDAFAQHTEGRQPAVYLDAANPPTVPPTNVLPLIEERAVALLTAYMVNDALAGAASRDITIDAGNGTVIPRSQRYNQLVQEAARLLTTYQETVEKLGVQSMYTAQVETLRRVSRPTNRLVPIYEAREWDNNGFVQRVLPPIDTGIGSQGQVVTYRGQYLATAIYYPNDEVDDGGARYLCVTAAPNGIQNVDPINDVAAGPDGLHGANWQVTTINSAVAGFLGGW